MPLLHGAESAPPASPPDGPLSSNAAPDTATGTTADRVFSSTPLPPTDVPADVAAMVELAQILAGATDYIPKPLRGKPSDIVAVMLRARALDITLAVAMDELYPTGDDVGATARLARGLATRAGHELKLLTHDRHHAAVLFRAAGSTTWERVTFTLTDAHNMRLTDPERHPRSAAWWAEMPENMCVARAVTRAVGWMCPEVLLGMALPHEEDTPLDAADAPDTSAPYRAEHAARIRLALDAITRADTIENPAARLAELRRVHQAHTPVLDVAAPDPAPGPAPAPDTAHPDGAPAHRSIRQTIVARMHTARAAAHDQDPTTPTHPPADIRPRAVHDDTPPVLACGCTVDAVLTGGGTHGPDCTLPRQPEGTPAT